MNIFIFSYDLEENARFHCNKHVNKMILESAQLLSTAVRLNGIDCGYKQTHINHPCSVWVRSSLSNWLYLRELIVELNKEWKLRFNHNRNHKSFDVALSLPIPEIVDIELTNFVLATPDKYKCGDAVISYRNYFNNDKRHLFNWGKREIPYWVNL